MFGRFRDKLVKGTGDSSSAPVGGVDKSSPTKKAPAKPRNAAAEENGSPKKRGGRKKQIEEGVNEDGEDDDEGAKEEEEDIKGEEDE